MTKKEFTQIMNSQGITCKYSGKKRTMYLSGQEPHILETAAKRLNQGTYTDYTVSI